MTSETDIQDTPKQLLEDIRKTGAISDAAILKELRRRKLVRVERTISYTITKGVKYAKDIPVEHTDLTADLLASDAWSVRYDDPFLENAF